MNEMDESQKVIRDLGFNDLRAVLNAFDKPANGRMRVLRARVSRLAATNAVNSKNISIFDILREVNLNPGTDLSRLPEKMTPQRAKQTILRRTPRKKPGPFEIVEVFRTPVHPDVQFHPLPFYSVINELVRPTAIKSCSRNSLVFHLTPAQVLSIQKACHRGQFSIQVQVRVGLLETTSAQDDNFPPGMVIKVNDAEVYALPQTSSGATRAVPFNVTSSIFLNASVANAIQITYLPSFQPYVAAVYLVKCCTWQTLLKQLKMKGARVAFYTQGLIQQKLRVDVDNEIATTHLRVHLVCPLGKMRMINPCRADTCDHVQCFDASIYLQMNEKSAKWMCPVCYKPAKYENLAIDEYFMKVLNSNRLPSGCSEIQVTSDGGWVPLGDTVKFEAKPTSNSSFRIESSDEDCEVLEERPAVTVRRPRSPSFETVDLISSSSSPATSPPASMDSRSSKPPSRPSATSPTVTSNDVITIDDSDTDSGDDRSISSKSTTSLSRSDSDSSQNMLEVFRRRQSLRVRPEIPTKARRSPRTRAQPLDQRDSLSPQYDINREKSSPLTLVLRKRSSEEDGPMIPLNLASYKSSETEDIVSSILSDIISVVVERRMDHFSDDDSCDDFFNELSGSESSASNRLDSSPDTDAPPKKQFKPQPQFRPSILQRAKPPEPEPAATITPIPSTSSNSDRPKRPRLTGVMNYLCVKRSSPEPSASVSVENFLAGTSSMQFPLLPETSLWSDQFGQIDMDRIFNARCDPHSNDYSTWFDIHPSVEDLSAPRKNTTLGESGVVSTPPSLPAPRPGPSSSCPLPAILRKNREKK